MKLFIWEGNEISGSYHDDGTLVVLAETPEQAREVVRETRIKKNSFDEEVKERKLHYYQITEKEWMKKRNLKFGYEFWHTPEGEELQRIREQFEYPDGWLLPDGSDYALDREPDRVIEIDTPRIVAFNGGGYD